MQAWEKGRGRKMKGQSSLKGIKLGIVVSDFNREITSTMESHAEKTASSLGAAIGKKIHVHGAFEIPFAAKKLFEEKNIDAVIVLGAVIQGKTDHDVIIVSAVAPKLLELSLKFSKPLGFGIIGPRVTEKEAKPRAKESAERAVTAAFEMAKLNKK